MYTCTYVCWIYDVYLAAECSTFPPCLYPSIIHPKHNNAYSVPSSNMQVTPKAINGVVMKEESLAHTAVVRMAVVLYITTMLSTSPSTISHFGVNAFLFLFSKQYVLSVGHIVEKRPDGCRMSQSVVTSKTPGNDFRSCNYVRQQVVIPEQQNLIF